MTLGELLRKIEHHKECADLCRRSARGVAAVFRFRSSTKYQAEALHHDDEAKRLSALLDRIEVPEQVSQEVSP